MKAEETVVPVSTKAEEYLEAIYRLEKNTGHAKTMELARQLKVVPGSITNTIEGLEKRGLVTHEPYRGVKLTARGRKLALNVLRRHRLAERLLTDILHVDWSKAHDAACKLEHAITSDILKSLEKALEYPKTCPHGNPIPTSRGGIIEEEAEPLGDLNPGESGIVVKVTEKKSEMLSHIASLGLLPGAPIEIANKASYNGSITAKVGGANCTLTQEIVSAVWIKRT